MRRDCTFQLHNRFYEAAPHLAGETIEARFDPLDPAVVEIYFQGKPEGTSGAGALTPHPSENDGVRS